MRTVLAKHPIAASLLLLCGLATASADNYDPSADIAATNAANAAAQAQVDAGVAATTQTEVQFNTIYSQGN